MFSVFDVIDDKINESSMLTKCSRVGIALLKPFIFYLKIASQMILLMYFCRVDTVEVAALYNETVSNMEFQISS